MKQSISNLKLAERGAIISISTYLILSAAKLAAGHLLHSSSLVADGFNNVSDIIGNVALLIGIRMARQPADRDHRFGHWKIEDLASDHFYHHVLCRFRCSKRYHSKDSQSGRNGH